MEYYIGLLIAFIIGVILIKKVASCIFRVVVTVVLLAIFLYTLQQLGVL